MVAAGIRPATREGETMETIRLSRRVVRTAVALAVAVSSGICVAAASTAVPAAPAAATAALPRITGFVFEYGRSAKNSKPVKQATAGCDPGKFVVGGDATVIEFRPSGAVVGSSQVTLTQMEPVSNPSVGLYWWAATATETYSGTPYDWQLSVTARCADRPSGYQFAGAALPLSDDPIQEVTAQCPDGKYNLGGGARIYSEIPGADTGVGLQVARIDALGHLQRAQAAEHPNGFPYRWGITATMVCAAQPDGWAITNGANRQEDASDTIQNAYATCPDGRVLLSAGGAISSGAPANATIGSIHGGTTGSQFTGVEHEPTDVAWGPVLSRSTCAKVVYG
jgi:hypothetical protein